MYYTHCLHMCYIRKGFTVYLFYSTARRRNLPFTLLQWTWHCYQICASEHPNVVSSVMVDHSLTPQCSLLLAYMTSPPWHFFYLSYYSSFTYFAIASFSISFLNFGMSHCWFLRFFLNSILSWDLIHSDVKSKFKPPELQTHFKSPM